MEVKIRGGVGLSSSPEKWTHRENKYIDRIIGEKGMAGTEIESQDRPF